MYPIRPKIRETGLTNKALKKELCKQANQVFLLNYFLLSITVRYWRENSQIEVKSR